VIWLGNYVVERHSQCEAILITTVVASVVVVMMVVIRRGRS
jgi:hypothetical protein